MFHVMIKCGLVSKCGYSNIYAMFLMAWSSFFFFWQSSIKIIHSLPKHLWAFSFSKLIENKTLALWIHDVGGPVSQTCWQYTSSAKAIIGRPKKKTQHIVWGKPGQVDLVYWHCGWSSRLYPSVGFDSKLWQDCSFSRSLFLACVTLSDLGQW